LRGEVQYRRKFFAKKIRRYLALSTLLALSALYGHK
jgi:hypothetical protein